jgi:hypothetical protein
MKNKHFAVPALLLAASAFALPAAAHDDAAFDHQVQSLQHGALHPSPWHNRIVPEASGDYPTVAAGTSADGLFMQSIAYYTRAMLDRAGWVNPYAPSPGYASGNYLVTVAIGDGVTLANHA